MSFTRMHNDYLDPEGHLSGDFPIDLTDQLEKLGRADGLCGKDADLDYGGQIKVKSAYWHEDDTLIADLSVYASICELSQDDDESDADFQARNDAYGEVVAMWNDYPGEWTGSDYWQFWLPDAVVRLTFPWDDNLSDDENGNAACNALYDAIFADERIKAFQESMTALAKAS